MNKFDFVKALREKCGYNGSNQNADIVKFYEENKDSIVLPSGVKSVTEILEKKVTVAISADAGEEVAVSHGNAQEPDGDESKDEELTSDSLKNGKSLKTAEGKKAYAKSGQVNKSAFAAPAIHNNLAKKSYQRKIEANSGNYFDDVDAAEYFGASMRLKTFRMNGIDYYDQKARDEEIVLSQKDGSTLNNTTGGNLVFTSVLPNLVWRSEQYGLARKLCTVVPMSSDALEMPRQTSLSTFAFAGDTASLTASDGGFDKVTLSAKKAYSLVKISRELLNDAAVSVADVYAKQFIEGANKIEDQAMMLGDGSATYGNMVGIQNQIPSGAQISGTGTAWASYVMADFGKLEGTVANVEAANLCYVASRQFYFQVMVRLMNAGGGNNNIALEDGPAKRNGAGGQFNGYPVYFSQVMPLTYASAAYSAYFGDIKNACYFGDRSSIEVAASDQRYFDTDEIAFRCVDRFSFVCANDGRASSNGLVAALKQS